jgi:uncharacterized protein (TIGR00255 family)
MTGFGRGEAELSNASLVVEVKCVNSRHLDLRVRLPRELAVLEPALRAAATPFFQRGQVEVSVRLATDSQSAPGVNVDLEAARRYAEAANALGRELDLQDPLPVSTLLTLPGVARLADTELDPESARPAVLTATEVACAAARDMRAREGEALGAELDRRLQALEDAVNAVEARADEVRKGLRDRLDKRLASLAPELELEPGRLEQEVVIYADRMDVTEETVRLRSHLEQFRETLEEPGPVGRKLEFLLQEMGREVNTIGSKASDVAITRHVVELKTDFEKLREQILNIE